MKNQELDKKIIDKLEKLDDIIQDRDFTSSKKFIDGIVFSDLFDTVFGGRDDEYIGMAFHALSVLANSQRIEERIKTRVVEIINRALVGINGLAVGKLLADDLRDFGQKLEERGVNESSQVWWFAQGGIAVADLEAMIQRVVPTSHKLFTWKNPLVLIKEGLQSEKDYLETRFQGDDKIPRMNGHKTLPLPGNYSMDPELKERIYRELTVEDTFLVEDLAPAVEYSYTSFEAIVDAVHHWQKVMAEKRRAGQSIFDINEEMMALEALLKALDESDQKTAYGVEMLKELHAFLNSSLMTDDGETDSEDDTHISRRNCLQITDRLLGLAE